MKRPLLVLSLVGIVAGLYVWLTRIQPPAAPAPSASATATPESEVSAAPSSSPESAADAPETAEPALPTPPEEVERSVAWARDCDAAAEHGSEREQHNASLIAGMLDRTEEGKARKLDDLRWLLRNAPDSRCIGSNATLHPGQDGYDELTALLASLAAPDDAPLDVLANYAEWVAVPDAATSLATYGRLQARDPENPQWLSQEANIHMRDTSRAPLGDANAATSAALAAEALREALTLADEGMQRDHLLAKATAAAAIAGDYEQAETWGKELLAGLDDKRPNNHARWVGHEGLGLAALGRGDAEGAIAELLQMSDVPPGAVQGSFGPSMRLADALLKAGHRDPVVEYLQKVGTFWQPDKVNAWLERLKAGETFTLNRFG